MTQYEMIEQLSAKMNVGHDEARAALEAGGWNALTATHLLEKEKFRRMRELDAFASAGEAAAVQAAPEGTAADETAAEKTAAEKAAAVEAAADEIAADEAPEAAARAGAGTRRGLGGGKLGNCVRRLAACGNRNRFRVRRGDAVVLDLPVTVLALFLLFAFWTCIPLLVIGLFLGCRYSFGGRELGREGINGALAKAADAADQIKKRVAEA